MLREVEENWTKTTLYAARAVTGGSPKRRSQQSNTLIVAASTFDGTYDYKCDGTADDVEIQAAIDYVYYTFGGGEIILTEGTYKITSAINIYSNIALSGKGASASIIERDGDIYAISIVGAGAGTEMKDFSISWIGVINKTANTNTKPLYKLSYVKDFAIVESSAYGCQGTGIQIQFAVGGVIKDCIVTYCAAKDSGTGGYHGILIADSSGTLVSGCTASNNGNAAVATQGAGITVGVVSGASSGVKITGCTADNNIYAGIAIRDGAVCSVTGCYASGNTYNGIAFGASGSGVTNGTVTGCQAIGNGTQGIELFGSDNCSVSGCIASSGNIDGIVIYSGDSNIISGNNTEGNSGRGIYVASGNNNVITGNRATNNTTANFTDSGTATTDSGNDWT
jgi:parallel beta-helix repeat protein